jgi:hypothetical protein
MKTYPIHDICRDAFPTENPDWREPYPSVEDWNDDRVAFEFLRRNAAYWEFVEEYYSPETYRDWPSDRLELYALTDHGEKTYERLEQRAANEFGFWRICDPRLPLEEKGHSPWTVAASLSARYQYSVGTGDRLHARKRYQFGRHSPEDTITIDLRTDAPVEAQVDFVRWLLNRLRSSLELDHRKGVPRFQRERFTDYLRLLDARSAGASLTSMAKCLYPRQGDDAVSRIRKQLKKAEAIRDGAYRELLLWSNKIDVPESMQTLPTKLDELADEMVELEEAGDSEGAQEVWAEIDQELSKRGLSRLHWMRMLYRSTRAQS